MAVINALNDAVPEGYKNTGQLIDAKVYCLDGYPQTHQNDTKVFSVLLRPAQLNVHCNGMAKNVIWGFSGDSLPKQRWFLLEPISV